MSKKKIYFHADDFGRSIEVSKNIMKCLINGNLNSVSIMVNNQNNKYHQKLKKLKKINKRLHLNLTDFSNKDLKKNSLPSNLNFIKLIFLSDQEKKKIYKEIELQIKKYKKIYKPKTLKIDGHEHIHMIPWILRYLQKIKNKHNIKEFRNSNENLMTPRFSDLLSFRYYRNLAACVLVKFLYYFQDSPKIIAPNFSGIIYSGIQSEETIINTLNFFKKNNYKYCEILIHPGYASLKESSKFHKNYFNFYNSKNRKKEFDLCFSKQIEKKLKLFNTN
tara:strand:+ start:1391 stop:2218 length:828 start_codon:yes stop_codon:yes gene_type:complete